MSQVKTNPLITGIHIPDIYILESNSTQSVHTASGAASDFDHITYTMPAGTMGANDIIQIDSFWSMPVGNIGGGDCLVKFGGTTCRIEDWLATTQCFQMRTLVYANNSTSAQKWMAVGTTDFTESAQAIAVGAVDTTADVDIVLNSIIDTDAEVCNLEAYTIKLIKQV